MELYSALCLSFEKYGERIALQTETGSMSYNQLADDIHRVGNYLLELAPQRQHIALLIPNTTSFPAAIFGVMAAGHIAVPFNPLLKAEELVPLLEHGETHILLYDPQLEEVAKQAASMASIEIKTYSVPEILSLSQNTKPLNPQIANHELSQILYTSGTTGEPKGVMLSHNNFYSNFISYCKVFNFNEDDVFPCMLPLFHSYAMTAILLGALLNGAKIILYPQFVPQKVLEMLIHEKNIILIAVPPMFYLLAHLANDEVRANHNIRFAVSGGGPLAVDIARYFEQKMNHPILEGYGLTETSPVVAINPPDANKIGTIGPPMPDVEVDIRDEEGNSLSIGEVGELCVRGELVMQGYYKNKAATDKVFFENEWLRTGDLACRDEEGYLQIRGRSKDLIVSGGENIYPREVEETLIRFPAIKEVAVVAKPNRLRSEVPYAFVVLHEGVDGEVTDSVLRKFCREHLAEYKVPDGFEIVESFPKTAKGSIRKEVLKQKFES